LIIVIFLLWQMVKEGGCFAVLLTEFNGAYFIQANVCDGGYDLSRRLKEFFY
jgi:hypothetical protein